MSPCARYLAGAALAAAGCFDFAALEPRAQQDGAGAVDDLAGPNAPGDLARAVLAEAGGPPADAGAPPDLDQRADLSAPPDASCGALGGPCCGGGARCAGMLVCDPALGLCVDCGYANGPCCANDACNAGRSCMVWPATFEKTCTECPGDWNCTGCGSTGQPCCLGNRCHLGHSCVMDNHGNTLCT